MAAALAVQEIHWTKGSSLAGPSPAASLLGAAAARQREEEEETHWAAAATAGWGREVRFQEKLRMAAERLGCHLEAAAAAVGDRSAAQTKPLR